MNATGAKAVFEIGPFRVVEAQADVARRQVETGRSQKGRVVVSKGLQAGEQVVRVGLVKLRDGLPVAIDNKVELNDGEVRQE